MNPGKSQSRNRLGLFGGLMAVLLVATAAVTGTDISLAGNTAGASASGKADFSVTAAPNGQSVQRGKSVSYAITVSSLNGFTGSVSLALSGLPAGTTGAFDPTSVSLAGGSKKSSTLMITTSRSTPLGNSTLTIRATGGKLVRDATVALTVEKTPGSLSIAADPASATVPPGSAALFTLAFTRTGSAVDAPVTLSLAGLPGGVTHTFSPAQPTGSSATLEVKTSASTPSGSYSLTVTGTTTHEIATANLTLAVDANSRRPFLIEGDLAELLSPGVLQQLDLRLTNTANQAISITNISVAASTDATTADRGCGSDNYFVVQVPDSAYPIPLAAGESVLLSVKKPDALPQVGMRNFPYSQDPCKSTPVQLSYNGTAQGK